MTLVFDERNHLQGQPGLHALIVGVSAYPDLPQDKNSLLPQHFGMLQLSSTALAAYKVYRWLVEHQQHLPVPLATCRLLLSPSATEVAAEAALNGLADRCTVNNFLVAATEWRADASSHPNNVTFFYFAGHGVQRTKGDAVLLLEGFGNGLGGALVNAVDINNIFNGMAASPATRPNMAQTQLYFVDACRNFPSVFRNFEREQTTQVFDIELAGEDKRHAPIFYAAAPGTKAIGLSGEQTLFSKALLDCLNGDAGEFKELEDGQEKWHVSVFSLNLALDTKIKDWNQTLGADQDFIMSGLVADKPICFLDQVPSVEVVLEVDPPDALSVTRIEVLDNQNVPVAGVPMPLHPHPYRCKWPAGTYTINASIAPPTSPFIDKRGEARLIKPPRYNRKVRVAL